mgnify:CR=1 FL=1
MLIGKFSDGHQIFPAWASDGTLWFDQRDFHGEDDAPGIVSPAGDDFAALIGVAPDWPLNVGERGVVVSAHADGEEVVHTRPPEVGAKHIPLFVEVREAVVAVPDAIGVKMIIGVLCF